jgi:hypothetical protein
MDLKTAFEKAGLPSASIAFAAACHDLARLALNQQADPARAVHVWRALAGNKEFSEALRQYLVSVSEERSESKSGGVDQTPDGDVVHAEVVPPSDTEQPNAADDVDQPTIVAQYPGVPSSAATEPTVAADQPSGGDLARSLRVPATVVSSRSRINAVKKARENDALVMSGVTIPDHRGGSEAFDTLKVRYYALTEERLRRTVGRSSVAYNLMRLAQMRVAKIARLPSSDAESKDIFSAEEMRSMQLEAAVFAGSGLISLPEELRADVMKAVA